MADRLEVIARHLSWPNKHEFVSCNTSYGEENYVKHGLEKLGVSDVEVEGAPAGQLQQYHTLLTPAALAFVRDLVVTFDAQVDELHRNRKLRKLQLDASGGLPDFLPETHHIREDRTWRVRPVPLRAQCRHVDLGDCSPGNTDHFLAALKSPAQGIQTDFDDGHCPTWSRQLLGLYNVCQAVRGEIDGLPDISTAPVLMLRPRAWNMVEHKMLVRGKEVPGPLFDFGLLMFHCGVTLAHGGCGPFFYLSKVEGYKEARLWNQIFVHAQQKLGLPVGTIKACVLIENILASFEMEEILYEMRDHSLGLNCGIWDYSASFVNKFGQRPDFVLPDRVKYVNMQRHFLASYMRLVVQTCHGRGAHATGGMAAGVMAGDGDADAVTAVCAGKKREVEEGVDGFMVYDLRLVEPTQKLFTAKMTPNQLHVTRDDVAVTARDLLVMPSGGVTMGGLRHNVGVGILFVYNWFQGRGHYYYKGCVEDSATAEISRSQVWQWIRHQCKLEDDGSIITFTLVRSLVHNFMEETFRLPEFGGENARRDLVAAAGIFEELVRKTEFPEFITTYLNEEHTFRQKQEGF